MSVLSCKIDSSSSFITFRLTFNIHTTPVCHGGKITTFIHTTPICNGGKIITEHLCTHKTSPSQRDTFIHTTPVCHSEKIIMEHLCTCNTSRPSHTETADSINQAVKMYSCYRVVKQYASPPMAVRRQQKSEQEEKQRVGSILLW